VPAAPVIPWYQSPVQRAQVTAAVSAVIALFPKVGGLIGVKTPDDIAVWVESVFGAVTVAAPILGAIWRAKSKLQPLTLTKAAAAAHPAAVNAPGPAVGKPVEGTKK
jgi:hypothetical protein